MNACPIRQWISPLSRQGYTEVLYAWPVPAPDEWSNRVKLPPIPILSDLDGTLIDSKPSVVAAFRWWAQLRSLPEDTADRIPFGRTSTDAAALLAPHLDSVEEGRLLEARQAECTEGVIALAGAHELIAGHERFSIVTSAARGPAQARLRAAGLPLPPVLVTAECFARGKPDPEPYLRGAEMLGAAPRDCIVLEDAPAGVEAGIRAGMRVIALLTTHSAGQLAMANWRIESLYELPALMRSW